MHGFALMLWFLFAAVAMAADFGSEGGPTPANLDEVANRLRQDPYDLELLISFGTSTGGSAGHIALAIRDDAVGDDIVYSANFYADRAPEHETGFYVDDLVTIVPKKEYLFKTTSSLGDTASFGLDFGEIYKRSVIGVRVHRVPRAEKERLVAYFERINADYRNRSANTEYHHGQIVYGYTNLNCAKIIGVVFKYGAGYGDLEVRSAPLIPARKVKSAVTANIPTDMAMKLLRQWNARGYAMAAVLYEKYGGSNYVDPHDAEKIAFRNLPDRFPSVLSLDFLREQGAYRDFDNLFAMQVLHNMGTYRIGLNGDTKLLEVQASGRNLPYPEAVAAATKTARAQSRKLQRRIPARPNGDLQRTLQRVTG
jgi:hypothetical protein